MIVDTPKAFRAAVAAGDFAVAAPVAARAAFLVSPLGFRLSAESAADNRYMDLGAAVSESRALAEHAELARALAETLPVVTFAGDRATPDAVFPNTVFATAPGRFVVGRMRHAERRREAARED
ncbi:MAG: arginine deiminase-related protein, partial [Thermoanaerobaculia bacterium]|nr:arginine deiminase-related protein [Thermoanaerobaculia bacterium]